MFHSVAAESGEVPPTGGHRFGQVAQDTCRGTAARRRRGDVSGKEDGRARVSLFAQAMRAKARYRVDTEVELRRGLVSGELRVLYQPVVDVATGQIAGLEALVRWQHPDRGLVNLAEFISVAEESGLIAPLSEFVLGEATRQLRRWHDEFPQPSHLDVAVNFSARQLT